MIDEGSSGVGHWDSVMNVDFGKNVLHIFNLRWKWHQVDTQVDSCKYDAEGKQSDDDTERSFDYEITISLNDKCLDDAAIYMT